MEKYKQAIYIVLVALCFLLGLAPAVSLLTGLVFALVFGPVFPKFNKKASVYLLQASVVGLGFGMNIHQALASGKDGMLFTIVSVAGTILIGTFIAKKMKVDKNTGYLISSGTAICGGSAIAAIGPVIRGTDSQMSVALGTIFILNAVGLFLFPILGHFFDLNQHQFGLWSAIAIHDTSSVVGAASVYGEEALRVATTVKLTRALWIIPVALATSFFFKGESGKIRIPWFIFLFILAIVINTVMSLPWGLTTGIVHISHKLLSLSLFFIGASLTRKALQSVGVRPMIQGVLLWLIISVVSLVYILY